MWTHYRQTTLKTAFSQPSSLSDLKDFDIENVKILPCRLQKQPVYRRILRLFAAKFYKSDRLLGILLSNTTVCMAAEAQRWLEKTDQIDEHIKRMQLIRQYPPAEVKGKKLLGAIVGAVVTPEAREYAEQNGFFILELTGEDVRLLELSEDFQPKEW
jgi:hypothetical protein